MLYCERCGYGIYMHEDLGDWEVREEILSGFHIGPKPIITVMNIECRACTEEKEREWEAFLASGMGRLEYAFNKWTEEKGSLET